jgi:hypothetical protein
MDKQNFKKICENEHDTITAFVEWLYYGWHVEGSDTHWLWDSGGLQVH